MKKKVLLVFTFVSIIYSCNFTSNMKNGNNLIHETSPYLLQHAQNPVNWSPWKNKYLEKAISENKFCLLYTSPSPRDGRISRMPSSA